MGTRKLDAELDGERCRTQTKLNINNGGTHTKDQIDPVELRENGMKLNVDRRRVVIQLFEINKTRKKEHIEFTELQDKYATLASAHRHVQTTFDTTLKNFQARQNELDEVQEKHTELDSQHPPGRT